MTPLVTPLGVAHLNALELPPEALVAACARAGFGATGIRIHPVSAGGVCYPLPPGSEALRRVKARLRDEGVAVNEVEFIEISPTIDIDAFRPMMETGAELGATCVTVAGEDPDFNRMAANFAALCDIAVPYGLRVDVEFMRWRAIATVQQAEALLVAAGRANAGVLVDALHLHRSGGTPDDVRALPNWMVKAVQLCDGPLTNPPDDAALINEARLNRKLPGDGELPLLALLAALPEGVAFSAEVPMPETDPAIRLRRAAEATRRLLRQAGRVIQGPVTKGPGSGS